MGRKRGFRKSSISCWQAAVTADLSAADRPLALMCPPGSRRFDITRHWLSPVPGQKLIQPPDSMIVDTRQHVGEPGLWIDIVEFGGGDEGVDGGSAPSALIGTGEGPVSSSDGDGSQFALGGIVRHAKPSVIEEAGKCIPAAEAVVDRLGRVVVPGKLGPLLVQPCLQLVDPRATTLLAHALALLRRETVDLALDGKQDVDAPDRLGGDWRVAEPCQIEELAPAVRPARGLDDRAWLAIGLVEPAEAGIGVGLHQSGIARQM